MAKLILVGDVNLMGVDNAGVPFARLGEEMRAADLVLANLECLLYDPPEGHAVEHEGFFADPEIGGAALQNAGIAAVGLAWPFGMHPIVAAWNRPLTSPLLVQQGSPFDRWPRSFRCSATNGSSRSARVLVPWSVNAT